jgi:hypothetical protein
MNNKLKSKKITLDDLAGMVKQGFDNVDERFDKIDGRLDKIDGRLDKVEGRLDKVDGKLDKIEKDLFVVQCDVKELKIGQANHTKEIKELKDVVHGVFRIEMIEIKKRLSKVEDKLGISN